jgi:membrane protease YdiL (CAAX protease family)
LAQRSGGLLAPMALHAVFNLVVAVMLLQPS